MNQVLFVCGESQGTRNILGALDRVDCSVVALPDLSRAVESLAEGRPDLVAIDLGLCLPGDPDMAEFLDALKNHSPPFPIIALVPSGEFADYAGLSDVDDFVMSPYRPLEVAMRVQRLLRRTKPAEGPAVLNNGDLAIDLARYEVSLGGKKVDLTFKEYELLRFLASTPGKVFTRETLLNRVWGYDYFGGTRTVDVHVRRLRSKIETTTISFIETVRNVGYRFKEL